NLRRAVNAVNYQTQIFAVVVFIFAVRTIATMMKDNSKASNFGLHSDRNNISLLFHFMIKND
ncbi:hypothetical protein PENTCL1PPCAC_9738, partial [Pristionchus entomophagus]